MFTTLLASARAEIPFHGGPRDDFGFARSDRLNTAFNFFCPQGVGVCVSLFVETLD